MNRRFLAIVTVASLVLTAAITGMFGGGVANAATNQQAFLTFYGWWDNTPPGNGISYPQIHSGAGGTGTFSDPITFASSTAEISPGTVIWVPRVRKYFIMEDDCQECGADWSGPGPNGGPGLRHYDLWLGGKDGSPFDAINCEDALTNYNADGTPVLESVIANPPSDEPFDPTPIFDTSTGACYGGAQAHVTVGQYQNAGSGQCLNDPNDSTSTGTQLTAAACGSAASQVFTFQGAFLMINRLCAGMSSGNVVLQTCTGGPAQQWSVNPNGTISDIQTGQKCVRQSGTSIIAGSCSGTASQWTFIASTANDFGLSLSTTAGSITPGTSTTATVTTSVLSGAAQSVTLSASGAPTGVTVSFNPATVTAGASSTMTISAGSSAAGGSATITVTGTAPSGSHTATYTLTVSGVTNDFSVSLSPMSGSVAAGGSVTATVATAVTSGSAQSVALSASGLPAGASGSFAPTSVTAGGSATLTIATSAATPSGTYAVTVTGTAASGSHTATYTLMVTPSGGGGGAIVNGGFEAGDFTGWTRSGTTAIVSSPVHSGTHAALLGSTNPTNGDSRISQTFTAPSGSSQLSFWYNINCPDDVAWDWATASLKDNTAAVTTTVLAKTCTLGAGWKQVTAAVTAGHSYTLTLVSHDENNPGDATDTTYDDITVNGGGTTNDFSLSLSPISGSATAGQSATTTVSTAVTSGSAQTVTLWASGLPSGASASFNPASVTAGGSSTLTITTAASTPAGTSAITVIGTATSGTQTATYTLTVTPSGGGGGAIVNGGFETGDFTGWTRSGTTSIASSPVHSGTHAALLGSTNPTNGDSKISQIFTAPSGSSQLSFWYNINCPDDVAWDWATAALKDNTTGVTSTVLAKTCTLGAVWRQVTTAITAGHSYTLTLVSHDENNPGDATETTYDDITVS
jgi:hypothetical protein